MKMHNQADFESSGVVKVDSSVKIQLKQEEIDLATKQAVLERVTHTEKIKKPLGVSFQRACKCGPTHINCLTPKEWMKNQIGVWQFFYEKRDIRDKSLHPATFPIALARRCIELFTHKGELVLDPFIGQVIITALSFG